MYVCVHIYIYISGSFRARRKEMGRRPAGSGTINSSNNIYYINSSNTSYSINSSDNSYSMNSSNNSYSISSSNNRQKKYLGRRPAGSGRRRAPPRSPEKGGRCVCVHLSLSLSIYICIYI